MIPSQFEYQQAHSVQEAVALLSRNPEAKLIAGGHSLLPAMKLRLTHTHMLVDISRIGELHGVRASGRGVSIGAMTTHAAIASSEAVQRSLPALSDAASQIGDLQVRNRGTLGGSLSHADPAADYPAVVLAYDATLKVVGPGGERTIRAADFFVDLFTTALKPDEILVEVQFPVQPEHAGSAYAKFAHPASGFAVAGVAAVLHTSGKNGTISKASVAVTGATATAQHLAGVESALSNGKLDEQSLRAAAEKAKDGLSCLSDHYASGEYRAHLASVLARKALMRAAERVK